METCYNIDVEVGMKVLLGCYVADFGVVRVGWVVEHWLLEDLGEELDSLDREVLHRGCIFHALQCSI